MSTSTPKKKRGGIRSLNKLHKGIWRITAVHKPDNSPIEPPGVNAAWRNDCGVHARENCKIIWFDWQKVEDAKKEALWQEMAKHYIFPPELLEAGKNITIMTIGKCLRTFRHQLNKHYVQEGRTPFLRFRHITPNEWDIFVAQYTAPEALARSKKMKELNQMNKFKHKLGPGGYKGKIPKWRKKEQEDREAGLPDPFEGCNERTKNWILGRSETSTSGQLVATSSEVTEVVEKAKSLAAKKKAGEFRPKGKHDILSAALGTDEHRGRTRALSSMASSKEGFEDDAGISERREREQNDNEPQRSFQDKWQEAFFQFVAQYPQMMQMMNPIPVPEVNLNLDAVIRHQTPSSAGSTHFDKYPVDDIIENTPCILQIPVGNKGKQKIDVAEAVVMVDRTYRCNPAPPECAVVEVTRVFAGQERMQLEYPIDDEGIELLGDARNTFILWQRKDIDIPKQSPARPPPQEKGLEANILQDPITSPVNVHPEEEIEPDNAQDPLTSSQHPVQEEEVMPTAAQDLPLPQHLNSVPDTGNEAAYPTTSESEYYMNIDGRQVKATNKEAARQLYKTLEPFGLARESELSDAPKEDERTCTQNVDVLSVDPATTMMRWFKSLGQYTVQKEQQPDKDDTDAVRMTAQEFWENADFDPTHFVYGKPLVSKSTHRKMDWQLRKMHEWYFLACQHEVTHIESIIPREIFNTPMEFKLHVGLEELHTIFNFQMMDITMMTIWCM